MATEFIRAWLDRFQSGQNESRRLIYALPRGAVTEPVANQVRAWLAGRGLTEEVALQVVMGPWGDSHGEWRENMHRPAIIVGTVDVLVSKALNRGYDIGRVISPIDFALVTNGAHWVIAEAGLCPQTTATLRRLAEFARDYGTAEPFGLTTFNTFYPERIDPPAPSPLTPRRIERFRGLERAGHVAGMDPDRIVMTADTPPKQQVATLSRADFLALFDTDADVDITPYVSDDGDLDAEVAWATWTPAADGAPQPEIRSPAAEYRCLVPLREVARLAATRPVWRFDPDAWEWVPLSGLPRPCEVLLVNAADGGYSPGTGFDLSAPGPVPDSPRLWTPDELPEVVAAIALAGDEPEPRPWQSLDDHSTQTRDQAAALVKTINPDIPNGSSPSVPVAAFLHDVGKAHEIWQDALCALAPADDADRIAAGRPWAKSGTGAIGRLEFAGGVSFRHELGSLLLIDGPLNDLLAEAPDRDLARYLVLAHHGRLRVQVPAPDADPTILGLTRGVTSDIPPMLGHAATTLTVDLDQFAQHGSWTATVLSLRDRYGPFILAYLETLVRVADWRASGARDLPQ